LYRRSILGLIAVVASLSVALGALFYERRPDQAAPQVDAPEAEATEAPTTAALPRQGAPPQRGAPVLDRKRADEMREQLRALFAEAGAMWGTGEPDPVAAPRAGFPEMPAPAGSGNQAQSAQGKYIQSVVREQFFPLARQCYESASAKHPGLAGKVVLEFRIVGDKRVGGVVDQATLGDAGTLRDDAFSQCMTESMMSVSFDAPPHGGEVTVKYPIEFSPDEPDGGD
jgi:hypothetical protein